MKLVIALATVAMVLGACGSDDDEGVSVTGMVSAGVEAPGPSDLPADATLIVTLQDVSVADATAVVLSIQVIELSDVEFPVAFELPYSLGEIAESNTYSVAARVESGGELVMISDTIVPVISDGAPTSGVEVPLVPVATN